MILLNALGNALADTTALTMRAHERAGSLYRRCRALRDRRALRLAMELRELTRKALRGTAEAVLAYCEVQGLGIRNFEAEVERRKGALNQERME